MIPLHYTHTPPTQKKNNNIIIESPSVVHIVLGRAMRSNEPLEVVVSGKKHTIHYKLWYFACTVHTHM